MHMRVLAPLILGIMVSASLALGQSLAEVAEKEKARRKNNDKEATMVVKNRRVWLMPEETKPESEASAESDDSDNAKSEASGQAIEECRVAQDALDDLERDQRTMETRYLQVKRKAQSARLLDSHGQRELESQDWKIPREEGREILGELTVITAGLENTNRQIEAYLQQVAENCQ